MNKAIRAGINSKVKWLMGLPYWPLVHGSWSMSQDEFWAYQAKTFREIYAFACQRVPYYRDHPDLYPPLPGGERSCLELLSGLPVLPKVTVRDNNEAFWATPMLPLSKVHTTSGTTGTPLRLPHTLFESAFSDANYEEWLRHICGKRQPRAVYMSGFMTPSAADKEIYWRDPLFGDVYLSIYSLSEANRPKIIDLFNTVKPEQVAGFASPVYQLSLLLDGALKDSKDSRIAVVTSEMLYPDWVEKVEATFCHRMYDYYSSLERSHAVIQCQARQRHICPVLGVVELLDTNNQPTPAGEIGKVVITSLLTRSIPLFRYEVGDSAMSTAYASGCSCGLHWPTIGPVQGRSEDLVRTRDGRKIGYLAQYAFKDTPGILEAQLVQKGYEKFTINLIKDYQHPVDNAAIEQKIRYEMERRILLPVEIEFRYVDSIPRGPRGKFKGVVIDFNGDNR